MKLAPPKLFVTPWGDGAETIACLTAIAAGRLGPSSPPALNVEVDEETFLALEAAASFGCNTDRELTLDSLVYLEPSLCPRSGTYLRLNAGPVDVVLVFDAYGEHTRLLLRQWKVSNCLQLFLPCRLPFLGCC